MKNILKLTLLVASAAFILNACDKVKDLPYYEKGAAVTLSSSSSTIAPALADTANAVVSFTWTNPQYATDSSNYKFVLEIDTAGRNFAKEQTKVITGALATSLTGREFNNILLNFGFKAGQSQKIDVRVTSSYANNNELYYSNVLTLTVTPFADPSVLSTSSTSVVCALATSTQLSNTFTWTASFKKYTGTVNYFIQYDSSGKGFTSPNEISIGTDLYTKAMTQSDMNTTALGSGITGGTSGKVEYRIKAVSDKGSIAYSNKVDVTIQSYITQLFLVGGSSPIGWTPSAAIPMIADPRFPGTFFAYAKLTVAGSGIKFLSENTDWGSPTISIYGDVDGAGNTGNLTSSGGGNNVLVPSDGVYRITVDLANSKYYLQTGPVGAVGLVGAMQAAQWDPPTAIKMVNFAPNKFIYITNISQNDEFKFHDGNGWDNSSATLSRWYDKTATDGVVINGAGAGGNFKWEGATGPVRAIFDYADINNPRYVLAAATEMRVVGDGILGVPAWNPGASPNMTYNGNGVWTITIDLVAGKSIKFLAGNDWGAFDYEDNSGGSTATGTPRSIKWDGGPDFKTPDTDGTYTITLDEYNQTVTIN